MKSFRTVYNNIFNTDDDNSLIQVSIEDYHHLYDMTSNDEYNIIKIFKEELFNWVDDNALFLKSRQRSFKNMCENIIDKMPKNLRHFFSNHCSLQYLDKEINIKWQYNSGVVGIEMKVKI